MTSLKCRIKKLSPKPGDLLVVTSDDFIGLADQLGNLRHDLAGVVVVRISPSMRLDHLPHEKAVELLELLKEKSSG